MKRAPVRSTAIRSVGYDPGERCLEIEFVTGITYRYIDVPPQVVKELLESSSYGRYINQNVRGRYEYSIVR